MSRRGIPDPLKPGHITGQNPATPERLPGHTSYYNEDNLANASRNNEEELGGRPAFLYRSGEWAGVTLDAGGQNLPHREGGWHLERHFTLGVRDALPINVTPEQIIRGIRANGHFVWRVNDPSRTSATTQ